MDRLYALMRELDIDRSALTITDELTGAGYIADPISDNVFCRWGYIGEGLAVLSAYAESKLLYRDIGSELEW